MDNQIIKAEIQNKIYNIRNTQVMIDKDLAELYGVETRVINQAVKRNIERFDDDFMFQLTKKEYENLKSHFVISSWGGVRKIPFVFTEQGVYMLATVLKSKNAVETIEQRLTVHDKKLNKVFAFNKIDIKLIKEILDDN